MVLTLNLKNNSQFIKTVFNGETNFFHKLVDILATLKNYKHFLGIINNLFMEEYKNIFFKENPDPELEELFIKEQILFGQKCTQSQIFFEKEAYIKLFSKLLKFTLSYNNYFSYHSKEISDEEKADYKLSIVQSLIRVIFSKEKKKYTNEQFYEYNLIKRVIDKDMEETFQKYGDEYKTLFRKEDICDDFLKYMFFVFGNTMLIESFVIPLKKKLRQLGFRNRAINKEEFDVFVTDFITKLKLKIPNVLKILLKLLYESIKSHFTIEEDNYGPLYTTLIFNFFISPRVQLIYL